MKRIQDSTFLLVIIFTFTAIIGGEAIAQDKFTTFILVRHPEKVADGTKDPNLKEEGKARAESLVRLLKNTPVTAIYSTAFIRTRETIAPLAAAKSLEVKIYEALKTEVIDKIVKENEGGTVVICGHSNNIPRIANYLTSTEAYKDFEDSDYGNILIVTIAQKGKASVTPLRY